MTIRVATLHDVQAISDIRIRSWRHIYREDIDAAYLAEFDPRSTDERWRVMIDGTTPRSRIFVDDENGAVTGFIALEPANAEHFGYEAYLSAIYLEPARIGSGLGRALFGTGMAWLEEVGYADVFWWVLAVNWRAIAFYEKIGAHRVPGAMRDFHRGGTQREYGYGMKLQ